MWHRPSRFTGSKTTGAEAASFFSQLVRFKSTLFVPVGLDKPARLYQPHHGSQSGEGSKVQALAVFRPKGAPERTWKKTLQSVIGKGRVDIRFSEISKHRIELKWPEAVTSCSAERLVKLARDDCPDFEVAGEPLGLEDGEECATPPASVLEVARSLH